MRGTTPAEVVLHAEVGGLTLQPAQGSGLGGSATAWGVLTIGIAKPIATKIPTSAFAYLPVIINPPSHPASFADAA
jgi:hypothetical protein